MVGSAAACGAIALHLLLLVFPAPFAFFLCHGEHQQRLARGQGEARGYLTRGEEAGGWAGGGGGSSSSSRAVMIMAAAAARVVGGDRCSGRGLNGIQTQAWRELKMRTAVHRASVP